MGKAEATVGHADMLLLWTELLNEFQGLRSDLHAETGLVLS